jgi:hypothetical protein
MRLILLVTALFPQPCGAFAPQATPQEKLERARKVNLDYVANMPNFVADETAKRYTSEFGSPKWRYSDTIDTEIAFMGERVVRRRLRRNGKPWNRLFTDLPGFKWYGGFGTEIKPIFDPQCPTNVEYAGAAELEGKHVLDYGFSSPADGCFAAFLARNVEYNPPRNGHAFVDEVAGNVIRVEEDAFGFPARFGLTERREQVSWAYVKIGEDFHLLPVSANFVVFYSGGMRWRIDVEYKNHRHFEAASSVTFQ